MKIAVLSSGEIRTLDLTLPYLENNLISPCERDGIQIDFFYLVQLSSYGNDVRIDVESLLRSSLGFRLKSLKVIRVDDDYMRRWVRLRDYLADGLDNVEEIWKNYLKNSGSMIEYYHFWNIWKDLLLYETQNNFRYDYVIRFRNDTIFTKPICTDYFKERVNDSLPKEFRETDDKISFWRYKMSTLLCPELYNPEHLPNIYNVIDSDSSQSDYNPYWKSLIRVRDTDSDEEIKKAFRKYIRCGSYMLTFRKNLIWVGKRGPFSIISGLGNVYGEFRLPNEFYWYNSETQFQYWLKVNGIAQHDYHSAYEERSYIDLDYNHGIIPYLNSKVNSDAYKNMFFAIIRP